MTIDLLLKRVKELEEWKNALVRTSELLLMRVRELETRTAAIKHIRESTCVNLEDVDKQLADRISKLEKESVDRKPSFHEPLGVASDYTGGVT